MAVNRRSPIKHKNNTDGLSTVPLVGGEYLSMVQEYKRSEKKRKIEEKETQSLRNEEKKQKENIDNNRNTGTTTTVVLDPAVENNSIEQIDATEIAEVEEKDSSLPPPDFLESDMDSDEFEDVDLDDQELSNDITVSFTKQKAQALTKTGKPKGEPKNVRISLHKLSLIGWMVHCKIRDQWLYSPLLLNNNNFKRVLPVSVTSKLFPPAHLTPFLKSKTFISGLREAMECWQARFTINNCGLASNQSGRGDSGNYRDYINEILSMTGSTDLLGQGFVAILRAFKFRVRLICSLQPPDNLASTETVKRGKHESNHPLFWAEVRDEYVNGWVAIDPLTSMVRLPTKSSVKVSVEPPANDSMNKMRYVIAFERRGCRDVTRRYASSFNAKTRKKRLPHFEDERFMDTLMGAFAPKVYTSEDKEEIKELAKYPLLEGIPTRVQDFVGHPVYALAECLHKNEILMPGAKPCGTLAIKKNQISLIYRREDVKIARSAQSWYRRGRQVKIGVPARTNKTQKNRLTGELDKVKMYTIDQTDLYKPPPVGDDGKVPKSEYHSIDIFTDTMIPEGGFYVKDPLAQKAAKILRVDYANAVTGVDFGKQGPRSRVLGVVVAKQYSSAVIEVISGLKAMEIEKAEAAEEARILELWRKLIVGIQIWERIEKMNPEPQLEDDKSDSEISPDDEMYKSSSESHSSFSDLDVEEVSESEFK